MDNQQIFQETSIIIQTQEFIKNFSFGFLYILQKDSQINHFFLSCLNLIQYLQLHSYFFRKEVSEVWKNTAITDGLNTFLLHLVFEPYFTSLQGYVIFLFIQTAFFIALLGIILYLGQQYYMHSFINSTTASIMRVILLLLITILFMPIMNFNAMSWRCDSNNNFFTLDCFNAEHIGYFITSLINLLLYFGISIIIVLTFYESRFRVTDITSKMNSRSDAIVQIYILIQEISFSIMNDSSFLYILLVINVGGSLIIFMSFAYDSQYHNFHYSRYHAVLSSVLMWSSFMMIIAAAMEGNLIGGTIIAWFVGIPFVIMIVLTQRDRQLEQLVLNVNKLNSADEIIFQTRYILTLLRLQNYTKYAVILDGYIEVHRQICDKSDCALKKYKPGQNKRLINILKQNNSEVKNDKQALLVLTLYQILDRGLDKFEKNVDLRIIYTFFLLEIMGYKHKALQELQKAEYCEPSFDTQFTIYKYKRVIESEIQEEQDEKIVSNHEILPISAAPPIISGLAQNIEQSAYLHMEFWSELNDDTPDIAKLERKGQKVTESIRTVQNLWEKLKRVSPNHQQSIILYSNFLIEVLNDKELGQSLNEVLRKIIANYNSSKIDDIDNHDFSNDPVPTIILGIENERFGIIQSVNQAAASLFQYTKAEVINQNISMLMPDMFGKQHDRFIEDFINNSDYKYVSKDRNIICKSKSNYLFQLSINIKPINSVKNGISFLGTFYQEKYYQKLNAFILVNTRGQIEGISQGCIPLLRMDLRIIKMKKYINDYFPGLLDKREEYFNKNGGQIQYNIIKEITQQLVKSKETRLEPIEYSFLLQCYGNEIQFSYTNYSSGYLFKFEKTIDQNQSVQNNSLLIKVKKKKQQHGNTFIFAYNEAMSRDIPNYEGFFKDLPTYSDVGSRVDESVINISRDRFNVQSESTPKDETSTPKQPKQMIYTPKIRYDEGIRTVRLFQNKIGEIVNDDEQIMEEEEQEYEGNQYIGVNQNLLYDDNEENKQQDQDIFQSRSHLDKLIDQNVVPFSIKFLTFVEVFFTISMIALAFTDYFLDVNQIADIQLNLDVYNQQTDVMAELQYVNGYIRDLQLLQTGIGTDSSTTLKQQMLNSLNNIQEKLDYVVLSGYQMPQSMKDLYSIPSITMQFENYNSTQNFQEATSQMLAYGRYIVTMTDETITLFSNDVAIYFFLQNGFNNYCKSLSDTAQYVLDDFISRSADRSQNFVILVVIAAVVLSISFAMIVIILLSTRLSKEYIVILFLELPNRVIRNLFNKCEQFARFLNQIEGEGSEKEDDFDHNSDSDEPLMVLDSKKKKKKKFKNSTKPPYSFYIQIFILACFMEAYFIVSLFMQKSNLDQIRQTIYESSAAIAGEQLYALSNNAQQAEFIDPDQIILDETVQQNTLSNLYKMYQQDSLIHKEHSKNIYNLEQVYIDAFNTIMFQNPCNTLNQINSNISVTECETFAEGSIKSGFAVALTRFVEKIRYLQTLFYQTTQDSSITLEQFGLTQHQVYDDALRNLQINLLQLPSIKEIKDMQLIYFRTGIRYLGNQFIEGILTRENSYKSVKLGLFIVYLILIILLYFFYWVPFHRHLMQDIWKTRMTLLMIPVDNLRRLKNAKAYVKGLVNKSM